MSQMDAYRRPRVLREGCLHQLGCRCEAPHWLRLPTPAEEAHEAWYRAGFTHRRDPERAKE